MAVLEQLSLDSTLLMNKVIWLLESRTMAWSILVDFNWTPWYFSTKPLVHKKSTVTLLEVSNFCKEFQASDKFLINARIMLYMFLV